jgi:hypothetical protein
MYEMRNPAHERNADGEPVAVRAYVGLLSVPSTVYLRMLCAACVALFAQWGTTGAAIVIAYFTPMVGFGCRSGSYLVYGCSATAVFVLQVLSAALSHCAMKGYQDAYVKRCISRHASAPPRHTAVCALAANLTRLLGKALAVANACVLVLIAVFEFLGMFENCWCKSCYPNYGDGGYAIIVRSDEDYKKVSQGAWAGGISMAMIVCVVLLVVFYYSSTAKLAEAGPAHGHGHGRPDALPAVDRATSGSDDGGAAGGARG